MSDPSKEFAKHYSAAHHALDRIRGLLFGEQEQSAYSDNQYERADEMAYIAGLLNGVAERLAGVDDDA